MHRIRFVSFALLLVVAAACGSKKSPPPSGKPNEGSAAASGSATPTTVDPAKPAGAAAAGGHKVGPIDLDAAKLDLPALFPGTVYELHPAEDQTGAGSMPDGYVVDTAEIRKDADTLVQVELDKDKVTKLLVFDAALTSPKGVHVGSTAAEVAKALPDTTCEENKLGVFCDSPNDPMLFYFAEGGLGAEWGTEQPIAKLDGTVKVSHLEWDPPEGKTVTVAARPTAIAQNENEEGDEEIGEDGVAHADEVPAKPTADQIDRCARVLAVTSACGVSHDFEFGWVKGSKKVSAAAAKKACSVESTASEDGGSAFPVPVLEAADVAKLEAAGKKGCKQVLATLDEVSPGMGPAGYDPSK